MQSNPQTPSPGVLGWRFRFMASWVTEGQGAKEGGLGALPQDVAQTPCQTLLLHQLPPPDPTPSGVRRWGV